MTARPVPAVVSDRDRFGERDVQPERPGDGPCHLGDLECVGQPGALVVVGKHEDLGLAGQAAERGGVQNPVSVAFETGSGAVRRLLDRAVAGPLRQGRTLAKRRLLDRLARLAFHRHAGGDVGVGVLVGPLDPVDLVAPHGGAPFDFSLGQLVLGPHGVDATWNRTGCTRPPWGLWPGPEQGIGP